MPLENQKEFFTVTLVRENDEILIEKIINPLGRQFGKKEIESLINYIQTEILHSAYNT